MSGSDSLQWFGRNRALRAGDISTSGKSDRFSHGRLYLPGSHDLAGNNIFFSQFLIYFPDYPTSIDRSIAVACKVCNLTLKKEKSFS